MNLPRESLLFQSEIWSFHRCKHQLHLNQASAGVMQYIFLNLLGKGIFRPGILKLQGWNILNETLSQMNHVF
jgi:hypothetical protein